MAGGYVNPFLHGKPVRECDSQSADEIRDLADAFVQRVEHVDHAVTVELSSLPKALALAVFAHMALRFAGDWNTLDVLRVRLLREAMLTGGDEVRAA